MPPKQKQVKKGVNYKAPTTNKDIVPSIIKEPARQPRPIKVPENFPEAQSINDYPSQTLLEDWPTQQNIKSHDFGIHSNVKYLDPFHSHIQGYIKNKNIFGWKGFHEIGSLRQHIPENSQQIQEDDNLDLNYTKSLENFQYVERYKQEEVVNLDYVVIQTYTRPQTELQIEKRKKQQAQKAQKVSKDKKKGKKQQIKDEGPLEVRDVKMSDILISKNMCNEGIWIGSQLQIIKQRQLVDVYNGQAVWKKIYPQQNGVPIITKSGKYWVKLYYMGKEVKVQIDDRVPINCQTNELFPISQKNHQKWSLILSKALTKFVIKTSSLDDIVGSGLIIYALTGMICQKINLNELTSLRSIEKLMTDQHYTHHDIVVSCYSHPGSYQKTPSNFVKVPTQMKNILLLQNSSFKSKIKKTRRNSAHEIKMIKQQIIKQEYVENNVINGCGYCLGDFFYNQNFNMVFAQQKSEREVKLRQQYNQMSKVTLNNKGREEKLQHRRKKKEVKQRLANEQKKRFDLISKSPVEYCFVKLLADIKIPCQYSQKQILLAKKCVLNKLSQPPYYDMPQKDKQKERQKQQNRSNKSLSMIKTKQQEPNTPDIDDFSLIPNALELLPRKIPGLWVKDEDVISTFSFLNIYYNPNSFTHKAILNLNSKIANTFTFDENKQILLIQKKQHHDEQEKNLHLLFGFLSSTSQWDNLCKPYCMLQKFDFQNYITRNNSIVLKDTLGSCLLTLQNQNAIFKLFTISKGNYCYWISSDSKFKTLSIADYLTEFEGYSKKNFVVEYPPTEAFMYFTFMRLKIKQQDQNQNIVLFKINTKEDTLKNLTFKVISLPKQQQLHYTEQIQQGVVSKPFQKVFMGNQYSRISILNNYQYYVILQSYSHQNTQQGTLQVLLLSKNQGIHLEQLEQVQPVKYVQKYQPNKYGLIFKQRIFSNNDNNISFVIKVIEGQQGQPVVTTDKKAAKKGGKQQTQFQIIEKPLIQKRNIKVRIFEGKHIIYQDSQFNQVIISGINLKTTKNNSIEYSIQAYFNLIQWPQAQYQNQYTNKLYWVIQTSGQDSIALVRDTIQQQRQKQTRKQWEDKQIGRAQKAKKTRKKFLLYLKKQNGQQLTEQQNLIVNAPRLSKKQQLQEQKKNEEKKGKGAKKDDKKVGKDVKKQELPKEQIMQRSPPKSKDNFMRQIKSFLQTLQNAQVKYHSLEQSEQYKIRSAEEIQAIKQSAVMIQQNRIGRLIRNIQNRQTTKIKQKDKKQQLQITFTQNKTNFKDKWSKYIQWRAHNVEKQKHKLEKQRQLTDIIQQQKPSISQQDLKKLIAEYKQISDHNLTLADIGDMVRKNIRIHALNDKINSFLIGWQVQQLKILAQQIKNDKIQGINQQNLDKMYKMLQEANKNPAIVQQKQAEAKKNKKGAKK